MPSAEPSRRLETDNLRPFVAGAVGRSGPHTDGHGQAQTGTDEGRVTRARELWLKSVELRKEGRELALDVGEVLKEVRDKGYHREMGFDSFEAFTKAVFDLSSDQAYRYIQIIDNVVGALPESVSARAVSGDNPLPVKILAQLHFDHVLTPEEVGRLEKMGDEEFKETILRLGYDRDRMGGRAASDLLREKVSKATYRDQRRKVQVLREKLECAQEEKNELAEQVKSLNARIDQILAAIENPGAAKTVKLLDALTARVAEMEKKRAEAEAEIAVGKEVGTRALQLSGEIQVLLSRFEDGVRIDNAKQWLEVYRIFDSIEDVLADCRGRMAGIILKRIEDGEITRFSVEDPEADVRTAEQALRPRGKK